MSITATREEIKRSTYACSGIATDIKHVGWSFHRHTPRYVVLRIVITCVKVKVKVKVNFTQEQAMKAQRWIRDISALFPLFIQSR